MKNYTKIIMIVMAFAFAACGGKSDYVYYTPPPPEAKFYDSTHKIKDIIGNSQVDMLWVVDNSGSMSNYQQSVIDNLSLFIDTLTAGSFLRWKIGLISTSIGESPYIGFVQGDDLTYLDKNADTKFKLAISKLGTSGDGQERTFTPVLTTLQNYPNFVRPDAALAIILVSDAPEQSDISTADFVSGLLKVKGKLSNLYFYGTLDPSDWCQSTDDPFTWAGNKFDQLLQTIQGAAYPICDPKFGKNLIDIGNKIVSHATFPRIYLETRPKINTLNVYYNGQVLPSGPKEKGGVWIYNFGENAVVFYNVDFAPGESEEVRVTYEPALTASP